MIYSEFQNKRISLLGMGCMRFPTLEDGKIDEALTEKMVAFAIENGVNYFGRRRTHDQSYPARYR